MRLLSGRMVIKNVKLKKRRLRGALTHCLAPIKILELVHVRRREKRDRKIVEVTDSCFKNYLIQKSPPHGIF